MGTEVVQVIILFILLLCSAFFSSAETSLTTSNKIKIKRLADDGNKNAKLVLKITDNPDKMLSAILIGNNIVNISASSLATVFVQDVFGMWAVSIGTGILTILVLIFGEITPKTAATIHANSMSLTYAKPIWALMCILTPIIFIINKLSGGVMFILRLKKTEKESTFTEDELRTIMNVSQEEGVIEEEEVTMINNVFDFGDAEAKDVMVPRIDMCMVDVSIQYDELINVFRENKYTRIPVYEETSDNVIGIVNIKDLILYRSGDEFNIRDYLRDAYYTYEYKKLSELMVEMKKDSINITIVLDEYGVTAGLITIEDLLEEIVGDIRDEYDYDEEDSFTLVGEREYLVDGQIKLDEVNDKLDLSLFSEDYDSLGGYIIGSLDRLPVEGDMVENASVKLTVDSMDKNRIDKIRILLKNDDAKIDVTLES
ncbi:MAG: HlyC/CorC family transporter [Lachnospiraceae bacterium]|nr:HlyC/CorC family transporter [Lachnospiraceae bacterium]